MKRSKFFFASLLKRSKIFIRQPFETLQIFPRQPFETLQIFRRQPFETARPSGAQLFYPFSISSPRGGARALLCCSHRRSREILACVMSVTSTAYLTQDLTTSAAYLASLVRHGRYLHGARELVQIAWWGGTQRLAHGRDSRRQLVRVSAYMPPGLELKLLPHTCMAC